MTRKLTIWDQTDDGDRYTIMTDKSPSEAIDEWFSSGYYDIGRDNETVVVPLVACAVDTDGKLGEELARKTFTIYRTEPDCIEQKHDWCSPHSVVRGAEEAPGVYDGGDGSITTTEVCRHCAQYRKTTCCTQDHYNAVTGDYNPITFKYDSINYLAPDKRSLAWVATLATA